MDIKRLTSILKERRETLGLQLTQLAHLGEFTYQSLRNLEHCTHKTRCDIALWYIKALGGELIVDSICIVTYDDLVAWFDTLKRSRHLTNYGISKVTGIHSNTLQRLHPTSAQSVNIEVALELMQAYAEHVSIQWCATPMTSATQQQDNDDCQDIVKSLQNIRWNKQITIAEVSKMSGVDPAALLNMEAGQGRPRVEAVLKYAQALQCKMFIQYRDVAYLVWDHQHIVKWIFKTQEERKLSTPKFASLSRLNVDVIRRVKRGDTTLTLLSCVKLIHALGGKLLIRE